MSCPCDEYVFPTARRIPAGLRGGAFQKARALGIFPDWRTSTLAGIGAETALDEWRAREPHDLGLMLVEMGAYVFDVCDFYDALIAGETFLLTAQLAEAQRRLVALLGYVPRPAIGAEAYLAAIADGRRVITLPKGVGFRSGAFDGEPPQVFELTEPASIDPRVNRLTVARVPQNTIPGSTLASLLVDPGSIRVRVGDPLVLDFNGTLRTTRVSSIVPVPRRGRTPAATLSFTTSVSVPAGATYSSLRILASGGGRGLWKHGLIGAETETAISGSDVLLDTVASIHPTDIVLFERQGALEARRVTATIDRQRTLFATLTSTLKSGTTVIGTLDSPPIKVAISRLSLDAALTFTNSDVDKVIVHHPLGAAARILVPEKETLSDSDPISVPGLIDPPRTSIVRVLLDDVHQEGVSAAGSVDSATKAATLAQGQNWGKALTAAVTLYGNVLAVSRGETVDQETLGIGDPSQPRQVFKLSKKPLTYLSAANANGYSSTLKVRVGGVLWREVDSFYGKTDRDRVFIVRQSDEGDSYVHFGGGAPLPSGVVVTASYRYGAGAAVPPAGSITQVARPVPGIGSVRNVLPAFGGGDAESPHELAFYAPRSALLLGRAISLPDLEVAAATVTGVRAARAMWRWDDAGLRAVAQILYIGSEQLVETVRAKLRALTEPDAPISVVRALPQNSHLSIGVAVLPEYTPKDVIGAVREALYRKPDLPGTGGLLRAERLGPEGVVFLSEIAAAVIGVDGVGGMQSVTFDGAPFVQSGRKPLPGKYFDFGEPGTTSSRLVINGVA